MSDKVGGAGKGYCDVCFRRYTWGCGHSASQERDFRRHCLTAKHKERRCMCFGHDHCNPDTCNLAQQRTPGYIPFTQHTSR